MKKSPRKLVGLFSPFVRLTWITVQLIASVLCFNSPPLGQNSCLFADDIFRCIFVNDKFCILVKISLKFVPKGPIDNNPTTGGSDNGLAPNRRQAIIWTNADPIHWRIKAALGGDELNVDTLLCL